jgi:hypothetical protein
MTTVKTLHILKKIKGTGFRPQLMTKRLNNDYE